MAVQWAWAGYPSDDKTTDARSRPELWMYRSQREVHIKVSKNIKGFLGEVAYKKSNPHSTSYSPQVLTAFRLGKLTKKGLTGGEVVNIAISEIILRYKHAYDVKKVRKYLERRVPGDWKTFCGVPLNAVDLPILLEIDVDSDAPDL
jgi:hypothetical protein